MDLGIAGRTALVAGGSAGLGGASALALAREGVRLFISARGEDRLRSSAASIRAETAAEVSYIVADHGTDQGRAHLARACPAPDILVITYSPPEMTKDYRLVSAEQWRAVLEANVVGSIELMRHFSEGMAARGFGRIVNISTVAAKYPLGLRMLSGASRAAVANYAVGLAKVVARHDVAINSLLPGIFTTPGLEKSFVEAAARSGDSPEAEADAFLRRLSIPARSYGEPADLGALCALLCSTYARYVVGQSLVVDGGLGDAIF